MTTTTAIKVTRPTGEVEYHFGIKGSEAVKAFPGCTIGIVPIAAVPAEHGGGFTGTFRVGEYVTVEHIGVAKTGRITKVGRTRVEVEVVVYAGTTRETTKVITRAKTEVR